MWTSMTGSCRGQDGVEDRDRRVREGARIDDDAGRLLARLLQPIDDVALVVGLPERDRKSMALGAGAAERLDVGERAAAVDVQARAGPAD